MSFKEGDIVYGEYKVIQELWTILDDRFTKNLRTERLVTICKNGKVDPDIELGDWQFWAIVDQECIGNMSDTMDIKDMQRLLFEGRNERCQFAFKCSYHEGWLLMEYDPCNQKNDHQASQYIGGFNDLCDYGTIIKRKR